MLSKDTADTIIEHIETHFGAHWHISHMVATHLMAADWMEASMAGTGR